MPTHGRAAASPVNNEPTRPELTSRGSKHRCAFGANCSSLSGGTRISTMVATRSLIQPLTLPGSERSRAHRGRPLALDAAVLKAHLVTPLATQGGPKR